MTMEAGSTVYHHPSERAKPIKRTRRNISSLAGDPREEIVAPDANCSDLAPRNHYGLSRP